MLGQCIHGPVRTVAEQDFPDVLCRKAAYRTTKLSRAPARPERWRRSRSPDDVRFARDLAVVRAKLIAKLKEFVAGDQFKATGEAVPPEYKELVDRFLRTLSAGSGK